MENGFIKSLSLIQETFNTEDSIGIGTSIEGLSAKLNSFSEKTIVGIVGPFGVGKSTLIESVKKQRDTSKERWIHFDAWQFPERKELWEGLILETAKSLGTLEQTKREFDGSKGKDKRLAVGVGKNAVTVGAAIATGGVSLIFQNVLDMVGEGFKYFTEKSPAKRIFEMQEVFTNIINKFKEDKIFFVLEDIDRSGIDGIFFLETLKQFITNTDSKKQIFAIVPISNSSYYANLESYLKCIDYVEFFNKNKRDLKNFISNVFVEKEPGQTELLAEFFTYIYNYYPEINLRKIKLILRQANLNYVELSRLKYSPNPLICIALQTSKYLMKDGANSVSFFDTYVKDNSINTDNREINRLILITGKRFKTYSNETLFRDNELGRTTEIKLAKRTNPEDVTNFPSTPYPVDAFRSSTGNLEAYLPDFYLMEL